MKKAFTLIELIFVIVIIGLLASIAVPKFLTTEVAASRSHLKSVIDSVQTEVDNIHGQWILNDDYNWSNNGCELNTDTGYPKTLDNKGQYLFNCVLRQPVVSCQMDSSKYTDCFVEENQNEYKYYFSPDDYVKLEYNDTNGTIECANGSYNVDECKKILY